MVVEPVNHERRYKAWIEEAKEEGIPHITPANTKIILQYIIDMEEGRNTARGSKKGGRSYPRLLTIRQRLCMITQHLQERGVKDITKVKEDVLTKFFNELHRGDIKNNIGERYKSAADYAKVFKSFWHWWQKVNRKKGKAIADITEDIQTTYSDVPKFVYLKKADVETINQYFDKDEQLMNLFLFDSCIRAPKELMSLRVSDVYEEDGEVWVSVPEEAAKTFGRSFNLLYCGDELKEYIKRKKLKDEDYLFSFSPAFYNRKLRRIAKQIYKEKLSHPKADHYKNLNLYDFRHSGAIHLRLLAKENPQEISLDAVRHRAGWSDFKMLNYYTQFLGMDGKINKQGVLLKQDKHHLEQEVETLKKQMAYVAKQLLESSDSAFLPEWITEEDIKKAN